MIDIFLIILSTLGILLSILLGYDLFIHFNTWQRRIRMGQFKSLDLWNNKVAQRSKVWLKKCPIIPRQDFDRLVLWDKITGKDSHSSIQSWQIAGLILGLNSCGYKFTETEIRSICKQYSSNNDVDKALLAYSLMLIEQQDASTEIIRSFCNQTLSIIIDIKGQELTIPYRKSCKLHRYVDTLGFVCPFLTRYAIAHNRLDLLQLSENQLIEYRGFFHPTLHLPPHAFNISNHTPLGVYDWGRGIGWYIIALIEVRRSLLVGGLIASYFGNSINAYIEELAQTILKYQRADGGFSMFITNRQGQYESSATVLAGLLFIEAFDINRNYIYKQAAENALKALMRTTQRNGAIDLCQGDTKGAGIYSARLAYMPFAQGLSLLLQHRINTIN